MVTGRKPYPGPEKSLVIGIDIGTAFSGVSYALCEPGKVPQIRPVAWAPSQREESSHSQIPSVVLYDRAGNVIDVEPETTAEVISQPYETEAVRREEWFKLRLWPCRSADERARLEGLWSPRLGRNNVPLHNGSKGAGPEPSSDEQMPHPVIDNFNTTIDIFAHFLRYLFDHTKNYIIEFEKKTNPTFTWSAIERNTYFVLTHPNEWEGRQQTKMRKAVIVAGLVDESMAADRITFVTEGEASLHFCLDTMPELCQEGDGILVVDCGSGTIDMNTYSQAGNGTFEEIVSPDCLLQGSIFITSRAREHFKEKLRNSSFGTDDNIEAMSRAFDKLEGVKCMFDDPSKPYFVRFGRMRDADSNCGIYGGKLRLEGSQVAEFFEPAVKDIIAGILNQCRNARNGILIRSILLLGGFGRSPYLRTRLEGYFRNRGMVVLTPDRNYRHKAVADGAVSWYLHRRVLVRVTKYSYGVKAEEEFDPDNPQHVSRKNTRFTYVNGKTCIPNYFSIMLKRGTGFREGSPVRQSHRILFTLQERSQCRSIRTNLKCYRGRTDRPPEWIDLDPSSFHDFCTIQVDVIDIKRSMVLQDSGPSQCYVLNLDLVILVGCTEFKAYIAWNEDGLERRTPACILYE